jgi:hypothetical protein
LLALTEKKGATMLSLRMLQVGGLLLLVLGSAAGSALLAAEEKTPAQRPAAWQPLFNGKDLSGWDTWLGVPHGAKEGKPIGLNHDPHGVYRVVDVEGSPAIRISGEIFGALITQKEYENYHLKLEFKWGQKKWPPRDKTVRDSGLLYHSVGPYGAAGTFWMRSLEFQIQEHDCGDFYSVAGPIVEVEGVQDKPGAPVRYRKKGQRFTVPSKGVPGRIIKDGDYEHPVGQWNTLELYTVGPTSVHVVNGHVVMVLHRPRQLLDGKEVPLTRGKIQLQSEGAEVFYRHIVLRHIDHIPEKLLK